MAEKRHPLDELLPLLKPVSAEVYVNMTVLEVRERAQLMEIAADSKLRRYLLARLSDTMALVDPGQETNLANALVKSGHIPRLATGVD